MHTHSNPIMAESALLIDPPKEMIPGVYLFPEEQPHLENSNVYVIKGKSGVLLIDCGNVRNVSRLTSMLAMLDACLADINTILLTDIHVDHCGAAAGIQKINSKIVVAVPELGIAPLREENHLRTAWYLYDHMHADYKVYVPRIDKVVKDNDILKFEGHTIRALSTPGHSPASITYIIDDDFAVVGDLVHGGYNPDTIGSNMEDWRVSLDRLNKEKFSLFGDGHAASFAMPFPRETFIASYMKFGTQRMQDFKDLQILWP
jgi:glyoxylase-like metal-dependent hydrolase (beta-lactamase superfamily II)